MRKVEKYVSMGKERRNLINLSMKASLLLCIGYQYYAMNIHKKVKTTKDILVVCEFKNVFLEELPGFPPQRKFDFEIELIPVHESFLKSLIV